MQELPFEIPESLVVYIEQFEDDPLKVTTKLKNHLQRRGPDAVGYFLLAWFYYLKGLDEQAIAFALKAKTFAPGSPLMEKLHYYLSHPDTFDAWYPDEEETSSTHSSADRLNRPEPVLDLDSLINRLSEVEGARITPDGDGANQGSAAPDFGDTDDIVSETLATIHETQGKTKEAIRTYQKLQKLNTDKSDYYGEQIERLNKELENNSEQQQE